MVTEKDNDILEFITCKYDRCFKEVFMKRENKDLLEVILKEALDMDVKVLEYLNLEQNNGNVHVRRKHFDLYLDTDIGKILVEVNTSRDKYVKTRNTAFICNSYATYTLSGKKYDESTKIIQINFNYNLDKNIPFLRTYYIQTDDKERLVDNYKILYFNMELCNKLWYDTNDINKFNKRHLVMLNLSHEELENISKKDEVTKRYMDELVKVNNDPKFIEFISAEKDNEMIENSIRSEAREEGIREGIEKGIQKGILSNKIDMVKNMLAMNMNVQDISKITGLTIDEISEIK